MSIETINRLDDQAVTDYLREHPDFFARRSSLLGELNLPHETCLLYTSDAADE